MTVEHWRDREARLAREPRRETEDDRKYRQYGEHRQRVDRYNHNRQWEDIKGVPVVLCGLAYLLGGPILLANIQSEATVKVVAIVWSIGLAAMGFKILKDLLPR